MRKLKNFAGYLLVQLLVYAAIAFVAKDMDCFMWPISLRFCFAAIFLVCSFMFLHWLFDLESENDLDNV